MSYMEKYEEYSLSPEEILICKDIYDQFGSISKSLLQRRLKCSFDHAKIIYDEYLKEPQ